MSEEAQRAIFGGKIVTLQVENRLASLQDAERRPS